MKRSTGITHSKPTTLQRKASKAFYQTLQWKRLRAEEKKHKREEHEKIIMDIYNSNPDNNPADLMEFITSDNPLCSINLKKNIIKVASILDHKIPIRKGGARLKASNLQWITEHEHAKKSGKEAHE